MSDLGTISLVEDVNNIMSFEGLSSDEDKLNTIISLYPNMRTGSSCFFYDTKKMKLFEKTTATWYTIN